METLIILTFLSQACTTQVIFSEMPTKAKDKYMNTCINESAKCVTKKGETSRNAIACFSHGLDMALEEFKKENK